MQVRRSRCHSKVLKLNDSPLPPNAVPQEGTIDIQSENEEEMKMLKFLYNNSKGRLDHHKSTEEA